MFKKKLIITIFILIIITITFIKFYKNTTIYLVFSDGKQKDSEIVLLDKNLKIKNNFTIPAIDITMASPKNKTILIPTSRDTKLFSIDKNNNISSEDIDFGAYYIKNKKSEQLILYNLINNKNRIEFTNIDSRKQIIDIDNSLLLSGDFDDNYIYVIGSKFDNSEFGETFLFIIDKSNFELKTEKKLSVNLRVYDSLLLDNKLFIGVDYKVDYLLYYDIGSDEFKRIDYSKVINENIDTKRILYDDNFIYYISINSYILKINRHNLNLEKSVYLENQTILDATINEKKLYILSVDLDISNQKTLIDILDCYDLSKEKQVLVNPIRETTPRSIIITK